MHFIAGIPGSTQRLASCGLKHQVTPQEMETAMTYQERYEKTNAWSARRIAKELMLMNGKNEIVREIDEQTICDAERQDSATRQLLKPEAKRLLA
jgi:hypothetical protein